MTKRTSVGLDIEAGLREAIAHRKGEIALASRHVDPMSPERIKAIRKSVARSPKEFEARFGIPARTVEGWEQDRRKPDPAARVLLAVIEKDPGAVERALDAA
ncbi:helix-turn-helix domain-containing protein [Brevundimonas sp.]|uniref:helix-turn-helix domain-containing protein n=1 Tax=Brevundimonas sp. TaxID=1871086 RepID=UPI003D0A543D